jgi:fructokinase
MSRLVCFGEALIDFLAQPAQGAAPRAFLQFAGGAPANVAVAAARLGLRSDFAGMLGEDMFGDFLLDSLRACGVGTAQVRRTAQARTALAFVALDEHGERSFSFYRPPAADLLFAPQDFSAGCFAGAGALHICSNSLSGQPSAAATLHAAALARQAGALVSLDLNLRPALWPGGQPDHDLLWQALATADIVKLARSELAFLAAPLGGEAAVVQRLWQGQARWLVVTDGAAPVRWQGRARQGGIDSFRVSAVDTTAAGDAFVGGLLARLLQSRHGAHGLDALLADTDAVHDVLRHAAAAGAVAVTRHGAFAAMPAIADIDMLLGEQP